MSMLAKADTRRGTSGPSGPGGLRRMSRFQESFRLRLQSFKEAAAAGQLPEGTIWLVRIIEAGQSLNGQTYTAEALRAAVPVFEGVTVQNYAWTEDPSVGDAGHLPDEVRDADPRGLVGNQIGSLEGVHFNETAQSLDGYLKVYDTAFREHLLTAYKLGDVGEGGERDVFGFSIDADGIEDQDHNVIKITSANELTAVGTAAAGGRVRRLVASKLQEAITVSREVDGEGHCYFVKEDGRQIAGPFPDTAAGKADADARADRERAKRDAAKESLKEDSHEDEDDPEHQTEALTHNSTLSEDPEPEWGEVDKDRLPDNAHANDERGFPHHFVKDGGDPDEAGRYTTGDMFLHKGGLDAAWGASQGARTGEKASPEVIAHLSAHRNALGLEENVPVKTSLIEKLKGVRLTEATALEEKARFTMLMRAVGDELDELRFGSKADVPVAEKVAFVQQVASDLVTALGSGGMQDSFTEQAIKENVATLAGQLKLSADQLSTASDEDAPKLLEAIRDSITTALDELSKAPEATTEADDSAESQEASSVKKDDTSGANATADDFARMSAGLGKITEALKSGDPVKLREAAVEAVGEEPQLDEKDKEINSLKERLKGQAINAAMTKLTEELKLVDAGTVLTLIDRTSLSFDSDFSEVQGLKEAIKAVIKDRPYFVKADEAAPAAAPAAAAAPEGDRQTEAKTPQEQAAAVIAADVAKTAAAAATAAPVAVQAAAAPAAPAAAPVAAAAAAAAPAATPLGQDTRMKESLTPGSLKPTAGNMRQLQRLQKSMASGNVKAMKKHRDLRARLGV